MHDFADKVILITGATSGLGEATAKLLASRGAKVALTGRRMDRGEAVASEIAAAGGAALFIRADVNLRTDVEAMVATTVQHFGRLDGAVNNAGIARGALTPAADITEADWMETIHTNLNAVWLSMKYEIPALLAAGGGAIVNMSSMYGLIGSDLGGAAYSASKFGVIGLTKSAAMDYGEKNIRINAVCPGFCHSEMVDPFANALPELFETIVARHSAMNRLGESKEVAEVIAWLLSSAASFVNGAAIPIEGGESRRLYR